MPEASLTIAVIGTAGRGADGERLTAPVWQRMVADADAVLAYTFGHGNHLARTAPGDPGFADPIAAGVKEGGTADTWRKAERARLKHHLPLDRLTAE